VVADPRDQVSTLWTTLPPSGPTKRVLSTGRTVSAIALFGCQKASCFCSWTLGITTLTLRVRHRPSGPAPIEPEGHRVGCPNAFHFFPLAFHFFPQGVRRNGENQMAGLWRTRPLCGVARFRSVWFLLEQGPLFLEDVGPASTSPCCLICP
jgi:hypothetical protein